MLNVRGGKLLVKSGALQADCDCCTNGACCNGIECSVRPQSQCNVAAGEVFRGVGTTCEGAPCSSCCEWNVSFFRCVAKTQAQCAASGGVYRPSPCSFGSCPPCVVCCYDFPASVAFSLTLNLDDLVVGGVLSSGTYKTKLGRSLSVSKNFVLSKTAPGGLCARYAFSTCGTNDSGSFTYIIFRYDHWIFGGNQCQDEWSLTAGFVTNVESAGNSQVITNAPCLNIPRLHGFATFGELRAPRPSGCSAVGIDFSKQVGEEDMWNVQQPNVLVGGMSGNVSITLTANPLP